MLSKIEICATHCLQNKLVYVQSQHNVQQIYTQKPHNYLSPTLEVAHKARNNLAQRERLSSCYFSILLINENLCIHLDLLFSFHL